jgi:hypothetical protein
VFEPALRRADPRYQGVRSADFDQALQRFWRRKKRRPIAVHRQERDARRFDSLVAIDAPYRAVRTPKAMGHTQELAFEGQVKELEA